MLRPKLLQTLQLYSTLATAPQDMAVDGGTALKSHIELCHVVVAVLAPGPYAVCYSCLSAKHCLHCQQTACENARHVADRPAADDRWPGSLPSPRSLVRTDRLHITSIGSWHTCWHAVR